VLGLVSLCHVISAADPTVTGTYQLTMPGKCDINMKAFGMQDTGPGMKKGSHIKVNGLTYIDSYDTNYDLRGFDIVTLDPITCKASNFGRFDTYDKVPASEALTNYIKNLPVGTHILAVTSDDAFQGLQQNAKDALLSIGVNASGRVYADKMIFHAIKGYPDKAIVKIGIHGQENLFYEEKPETCPFCQNGGTLIVNADGTGFQCQCIAIYSGLYCEKFSKEKCTAYFVEHEAPVKTQKRRLW